MSVTTEALWSELHGSLVGFVRRRIPRPDDADDVVQRVFLKVHQGLPLLRDRERVHAWIYQLARHAIADHYRKPAARREIASGDLADLDAAPPRDLPVVEAEENRAVAELATCLDPFIDALSETDREALRLVEIEGLTQAEASRRLGLSLSGMKSRIQRARRRLKDRLEDCCRFELDRRGGVMSYKRRGPRC